MLSLYFCTPKSKRGSSYSKFLNFLCVFNSVAQLVAHPDFIGRVLGSEIVLLYFFRFCSSVGKF